MKRGLLGATYVRYIRKKYFRKMCCKLEVNNKEGKTKILLKFLIYKFPVIIRQGRENCSNDVTGKHKEVRARAEERWRDNEFAFGKDEFMILWGLPRANTSRLVKY